MESKNNEWNRLKRKEKEKKKESKIGVKKEWERTGKKEKR